MMFISPSLKTIIQESMNRIFTFLCILVSFLLSDPVDYNLELLSIVELVKVELKLCK